jgi:hypothetical protein
MKARSGVFVTVVGLIALASPIHNCGRSDAAEGGPGLSSESIPIEPLQRPPEVRLFDDLTRWSYRSFTQHLSCEDVCKKEPKRFQVLEMSTHISPPDGNEEVGALARKVG